MKTDYHCLRAIYVPAHLLTRDANFKHFFELIGGCFSIRKLFLIKTRSMLDAKSELATLGVKIADQINTKILETLI